MPFKKGVLRMLKKKIDKFLVSKNDKLQIINSLTIEKYIDEERFAISYCQGKFNIKKWGKQKIKNELIKKKFREKT